MNERNTKSIMFDSSDPRFDPKKCMTILLCKYFSGTRFRTSLTSRKASRTDSWPKKGTFDYKLSWKLMKIRLRLPDLWVWKRGDPFFTTEAIYETAANSNFGQEWRFGGQKRGKQRPESSFFGQNVTLWLLLPIEWKPLNVITFQMRLLIKITE